MTAPMSDEALFHTLEDFLTDIKKKLTNNEWISAYNATHSLHQIVVTEMERRGIETLV